MGAPLVKTNAETASVVEDIDVRHGDISSIVRSDFLFRLICPSDLTQRTKVLHAHRNDIPPGVSGPPFYSNFYIDAQCRLLIVIVRVVL